MRFVVTIDPHDETANPGAAMAQVIRAAADVIERANPLVAGMLPHRLSGEILASWGFGPVLTSLEPNPTTEDLPQGKLICHGSGFTTASVIRMNNVTMATIFVSDERLEATTDWKTSPGVWPVLIRTPDFPDTQTIDWVFEARPTLTSLSPNPTLAAAGNLTLTAIGTGFTAASQIFVNNVFQDSMTFVSEAEISCLSAALSAPGTKTVFVRTPGTPDTPPLDWVFQAQPTLTDLVPNPCATGQGSITLAVNGTDFTAASVCWINGNPYPTVFVSPTRLDVSSGTMSGPGSWNVLVRTPGCADTNTIDWVFQAPPTLTSLVPNPMQADPAGTMLTLRCLGTYFTAASVVVVSNEPRVTTLVSPTEVTINIDTRPDAGQRPVYVQTPNMPNTAVIQWVFDPVPLPPVLTSLEPDPIPVATAPAPLVTLICHGSNFTAASIIRMANMDMVTRFVSATRLETDTVSSTSAGSWPVLVRTPGFPDTATINWDFQVPGPTLTSISPASFQSNMQVPLFCYGERFTSASKIAIDGVVGTYNVTFVSATELSAIINPAATGVVWQVSVRTSGFPDTASFPMTFTAPP